MLAVKNSPGSAGDIRDTGLIPGSEDPLEEGIVNHSSGFSRQIPGQRSLVGYSP